MEKPMNRAEALPIATPWAAADRSPQLLVPPKSGEPLENRINFWQTIQHPTLMSQNDYLSRIAAVRATKSSRTSQEAYDQVDRMAKSTVGGFVTKAADTPPDGRKQQKKT
ncbi:hypothetical protein JIN84_19050 [Luteolibacter yonseiensis]|uniref:Uncharacterized protein n=1 Tax=Luteolibacter yonseiensis TaxID=1144680 RepID=A0A934R930_9BACT|nr:hypothetical protein [Luteolibacter yonseiensis]MBK1817725.1 hypothetical protein [Luteolibacter yonseiensis]